MTDITLVVFDMAGTTIKDDGQVPRAFAEALSRQGISASVEALNRVRGSSKRHAIQQFIPEGPDRGKQTENAYTVFKATLASAYQSEGVVPIPGSRETFEWLRSRGITVALNTGFDRDITELLITSLGWQHDVVDVIVSGDDVKRGRPAPDLILRAMELTGTPGPESVASVGDTMLDLQAGHAARVRWNIGVLSGAHRREQLAGEPHTHLLPSVADLPGLWESWSPRATSPDI
ncbi:MAG: phosphonatase-like hydrolase [Gemmatimonadota bacterium]